MKATTFHFLLEIAKCAYFKKSEIDIQLFEDILKDQENTYNLLKFNGLRPAAFLVFGKKLQPYKFLYSKLKDYHESQTLINLRNKILNRDLLFKLKEQHIRALPYKGQYFNSILFPESNIRESGDIDILIEKENIETALHKFIDWGYDFMWFNQKDRKLKDVNIAISNVLNSEGKYELNMYYDNAYLDIHWGLNYGFLPYKVPFDLLFENTQNADFFGKNISLPSPYAMLWMIILHHGGKELWVRQKHWMDLLAFYQKFENEIDWNTFLIDAKKFKLYVLSLYGFFILKKYFNITLNKVLEEKMNEIDHKKVESIISYMVQSQEWKTFFPRIKYEKLLISLQDEGFSKSRYLYQIYEEYSKPNPLEHGRIWEFKPQYKFLNFLSKILTYMIKKLF